MRTRDLFISIMISRSTSLLVMNPHHYLFHNELLFCDQFFLTISMNNYLQTV